MGTIAQKVAYLNETKELIKESLNNLGADITDEETFREYIEKISQLAEEFPQENE